MSTQICFCFAVVFINFLANYRVPPVIWWVSLNVNERHAGHFALGLGAGLGLLDLGSFPSMLPCFFLPLPALTPPPSLSDELPDHHKF